MSKAYNDYLENHISNVKKAFDWIVDHDILEHLSDDEIESYTKIVYNHDRSKYSEEEYESYDSYFYPETIEKEETTTEEMVENFNRAWLHHIHENPHHWQHWVLYQDDGDVIPLHMPYVYVIEMICNWWSFGLKTGDLYEIFAWYEENKQSMTLNSQTRCDVETILEKIKKELDAEIGRDICEQKKNADPIFAQQLDIRKFYIPYNEGGTRKIKIA